MHPDSQRLTAYLLGKLSPQEVKEIGLHLAGCPDCRGRAEALATCTDAFVAGLRGAAAPADDPALERLLAHARGLGRAAGGERPAAALVAGHELLRELARGGLGVVYLARHPLLDDLRAIKR